MKRNRLAVFSIVLTVGVLIPRSSSADCMPTEDGRSIQIQATACQKISPGLDPTIKTKAGEMYETWHLEKLYTGALVSVGSGQKWMYPSTEENPCKEFPLGKSVTKAAYESCCDTGAWGKCVFGGNFLGDVGGAKVNSFQ